MWPGCSDREGSGRCYLQKILTGHFFQAMLLSIPYGGRLVHGCSKGQGGYTFAALFGVLALILMSRDRGQRWSAFFGTFLMGLA